MASKRMKNVEIGSSSKSKRKSRAANEYGVIFKDANQRDRFSSLHDERLVVPTRYPHFSPTLETLGLDQNVKYLLSTVRWGKFLKEPRATYVGLTLEFLSSLEFSGDEGETLHLNHQIRFRLFNEDFDMRFDDFCQMLGFENRGYIHDSGYEGVRPPNYNPDVFWSQITGTDRYEARSAKASLIHNPVFRYVARIMACTVFGRGEMGGVRTGELFCLWAMAHGQPINTCHYILGTLAHIAHQQKGDIVIGGMVTYIAEKLGLQEKLQNLQILPGNQFIDMEICKSMFLVKPTKKGADTFYLLISKQKSIILPCPHRTDTRSQSNWLYLDAATEIQQEAPVPAQEEEMAEQQVHHNQNFDMQAWCQRIEEEQKRQGEEQKRQGEELQRQNEQLQLIREDQLYLSQQNEHQTDMLQSLMRHFNLNQGPPPGQL